MPADPGLIAGEDVTLVPVRPGQSAALLAGDLDGRSAGRGWPHQDTAPALAFAEAGGWTWLVVDGAGAVVGELGVKATPDEKGAVEIGYGLAGPSRGRGLGTRAVRALVGWLGARSDVRMITARVAPGNVASGQLLLRLGFAVVGHVAGEEVYELAV